MLLDHIFILCFIRAPSVPRHLRYDLPTVSEQITFNLDIPDPANGRIVGYTICYQQTTEDGTSVNHGNICNQTGDVTTYTLSNLGKSIFSSVLNDSYYSVLRLYSVSSVHLRIKNKNVTSNIFTLLQEVNRHLLYLEILDLPQSSHTHIYFIILESRAFTSSNTFVFLILSLK